MTAQQASERLYVHVAGDPAQGPESSAPPGTLHAWSLCAALRRYVSHAVMYRESFDEPAEVIERVLPDGAIRLAFNWGEAPSAGPEAGFAVEAIGASAAPALVRLRGQVEGLSLTLRAGTAPVLLGLPAGHLEGQAVPLDELWRGEGRVLWEQMAEAGTDAARLVLLERALLRRLQCHADSEDARAAHAAELVMRAAGSLKLRTLAGAVGVGERRLQQLFRDHVGMTPREWSRVARLQACLRALRSQPRPGLAQLAVQCGYYDQAHFTNEFRALSGLTPNTFLRRTIAGSSKTLP